FLLPIGFNTGGLFDSRTTIVKIFWSLNGGTPLSVTLTVMVFVLGPCASLGVPEQMPLADLMVAPERGLTKLKPSVFAGRSVALAVKVSGANSLTVLLPMGASTGGEFTSLTAMLTDWVALRLGAPLSVTRTVIG